MSAEVDREIHERREMGKEVPQNQPRHKSIGVEAKAPAHCRQVQVENEDEQEDDATDFMRQENRLRGNTRTVRRQYAARNWTFVRVLPGIAGYCRVAGPGGKIEGCELIAGEPKDWNDARPQSFRTGTRRSARAELGTVERGFAVGGAPATAREGACAPLPAQSRFADCGAGRHNHHPL